MGSQTLRPYGMNTDEIRLVTGPQLTGIRRSPETKFALGAQCLRPHEEGDASICLPKCFSQCY